VVDFLYLARAHRATFPGRVTLCVFPEYRTLASLVADRVLTVPPESVWRLTNGFAYVAQPVAPGAQDDPLDPPAFMGYTPSRRRHRRAFLDDLADLIPPQEHPFDPALLLTVRFGSRRWLPILDTTREVVSLFLDAYPKGGVLLHGTPAADGFPLGPEWNPLTAHPRVRTVFDADPLVQASWCAAADVCLQGSGAAQFLPAIFRTPTVTLGFGHDLLVEYVDAPADRTLLLPAGDFVQDTPVNRSYHSPSPREALAAVAQLLERHGSTRRRPPSPTRPPGGRDDG